MTYRLALLAALLAGPLTAAASAQPFHRDRTPDRAPDWESLDVLQINRDAPRATFFPFPSRAAALAWDPRPDAARAEPALAERTVGVQL